MRSFAQIPYKKRDGEDLRFTHHVLLFRIA